MTDDVLLGAFLTIGSVWFGSCLAKGFPKLPLPQLRSRPPSPQPPGGASGILPHPGPPPPAAPAGTARFPLGDETDIKAADAFDRKQREIAEHGQENLGYPSWVTKGMLEGSDDE